MIQRGRKRRGTERAERERERERERGGDFTDRGLCDFGSVRRVHGVSNTRYTRDTRQDDVRGEGKRNEWRKKEKRERERERKTEEKERNQSI